jgi:epoxyqueuosine reductase
VQNLSEVIKEKAAELGFDLCGIVRSRSLDERLPVIKKWCESGMHDKMSYLERNIEKRINPEFIFPGARSLVVTGLSYYSEIKQKDPDAPILSRYVYGYDYHDVIEEKLSKLLLFIQSLDENAEGRAFVDSAPILEKAWAVEAGLGWQGRNSILINKDKGSFFFIGILVLNIDLEYDTPFTEDLCGTCTLCIDACPTSAINDNRTIDARKCIANLTIENRGTIPEAVIPKMGRRIYGCDRCQEVCPWNENLRQNNTPDFELSSRVSEMTADDWLNLSQQQFSLFFGQSAMSRVKYEQLKRNISLVLNSVSSG